MVMIPAETILMAEAEAKDRAAERVRVGVASIQDKELLERAVRGCRARHTVLKTHPRWVAVMEVFALGSTYSAELCRRFGLDPDEQVSR